jgi:4-amino-4-deoxy-L-arabinose transferase-like glycosyltransferase
MHRRHPRLFTAALAVIVLTYCLFGVAYAVNTPKWQAPDEPAHYNYLAYVAEKVCFPVLQMGDYPHDYLEQIKAAGFPPEMSIAPIRYEFHQPPLYYVAAALIYRVATPLGFDAQFLALRLFSVLLGAILLLIAHAIVCELFPKDRLLGLTATSFIATIPMHIATTSAINNDTLAELILALVIWLCVRQLKAGLSQRQTVMLGVLLALALLTKTTIYAPVLLSSLLVLTVRWRERGRRAVLRRLVTVYGLALLLSGWWFARNLLVYGDLDLLAWQRHDSVVVGQPTTAQWIGQYGLAETVRQFVIVSFRSFWAQFGWMGVLVDSRLYLLLAVFSFTVCLGLVIWLVRVARRPELLSTFQRLALILLLLIFTLVGAEHVSYNLKFVQHQGRYLFPALVPISIAFALGLLEWPLMVGDAATRVGPSSRVTALLPTLKAAVLCFFYVGFLALDIVCLYFFIIPQLRC